MNNTEEQHPVFIPRNFIEKGTFMGGMFKIRNAIEGGILAILITIPVVNLPLILYLQPLHHEFHVPCADSRLAVSTAGHG